MLVLEPKPDLAWLRENLPIFRKMEEETRQRLESESQYRKIKEGIVSLRG